MIVNVIVGEGGRPRRQGSQGAQRQGARRLQVPQEGEEDRHG